MQTSSKRPSLNVDKKERSKKSYADREALALDRIASLLDIPPLTLSIWWGDRKGLPILDPADQGIRSLRAEVLKWAAKDEPVTRTPPRDWGSLPDTRQKETLINRYVHINDAATDLFFEEAEDYTRWAVAHQGQSALKSPRSSAIIREAGHAVVYAAFGFQVTQTRIFPLADCADQWRGETLTDGADWQVDSMTSPEHDYTVAACLFSGSISEDCFDRDNFSAASYPNEVVLLRMIIGAVAFKLRIPYSDLLGRVFGTTAEILMQNAEIVKAIAGVLDQQGVVHHERLAILLGGVESLTIQICDKCRASGKYPIHN